MQVLAPHASIITVHDDSWTCAVTSKHQHLCATPTAGNGMFFTYWCDGDRMMPSDAAEAALQPGDAAVGGMEATCSKEASQEDGSVLFELD